MRNAIARVRRPSGPSSLHRSRVATLACLAVLCGALAGCGAGDEKEATPVPAGASQYAALGDDARLAAAARCRELIASRARGVAAEQIAAVKPELLRAELDVATAATERAPFRAVCARSVPRVTPGLDVALDGVTGNGRSFAYPTRSDRPLTIRGRIQPPPEGRVVARREIGGPHPAPAEIDAEGRFVFRAIKLRKMADNSFILRIDAPPNAPRVVQFSALCLDCGAGAVVPAP
jgi:hypothetical protein